MVCFCRATKETITIWIGMKELVRETMTDSQRREMDKPENEGKHGDHAEAEAAAESAFDEVMEEMY